MTATVRVATGADRDQLVRLLVDQLREHDIATPAADVGGTVDALLERPHRARFLVAVEHDRIIGVAAVSFAWPIEHGGRGAWLEELFVEPAARGRGIGAGLLGAACDVAAATGAVAIDLEVERSHARAAKLYARHGFRALERTHWVRPLTPARSPRSVPPDPATGGCFCGAVRYEARGRPRDVSHCHCASCRRCAGAPVVTWATWPRDAVVVRGTPATLHSSPPVTRTFCGACGTPLTYHSTGEPDWVDITVASMDHPDALAPDEHIWTGSRLSWLVIDDDLPRHPHAHR